MQSAYLICVGKLKEKYLRDACGEYIKRLSAYAKLTVTEVDEYRLPASPSQGDIAVCLKKEGERIISKIPSGARVYAMCIEGKQMSSEKLADDIRKAAVSGKSSLVFIIGGSYGLDESVKKLADVRLSMSEMTFPHMLARVMLLEQLYRAFSINNDGKYHK